MIFLEDIVPVCPFLQNSSRNFISTALIFFLPNLSHIKVNFTASNIKSIPRTFVKILSNTYLFCSVAVGFYETIYFCHITNPFAVNVFSSIELSVVKVFPKAFDATKLILHIVCIMIIVMALLLERGSLGLITWRSF